LVAWNTEYELSNTHFDVLRRHENELMYTKVGTVAAAGNSAVSNSYSFTDDISTLPEGRITYKLHVAENTDSVNKTGTDKEQEITGSFDVVLYPNPVVDRVNLEFIGNMEEKVQLTITNSAGQPVMEVEEAATDRIRLDISMLPSGVYYVDIITGDKHLVKKFVKQH
jgi:hypothetical protein